MFVPTEKRIVGDARPALSLRRFATTTVLFANTKSIKIPSLRKKSSRLLWITPRLLLSYFLTLIAPDYGTVSGIPTRIPTAWLRCRLAVYSKKFRHDKKGYSYPGGKYTCFSEIFKVVWHNHYSTYIKL